MRFKSEEGEFDLPRVFVGIAPLLHGPVGSHFCPVRGVSST